jgi:hypothetical protein
LEVFGEDLADSGLAVEPGDEFGALFGVVEAAIELVAEGARETGDFAVAGFGHGFVWVVVKSESRSRESRKKAEIRKADDWAFGLGIAFGFGITNSGMRVKCGHIHRRF